MNRFIFIFILIIAWTATCIFATYSYVNKTKIPVIIQGETIWKDKIIYRDYKKLSVNDIVEDLKCYDQAEFNINIKHLNSKEYRITSSLCERSAYKDIEIECGESGNYKLYLGVGIAVAAVGLGIWAGSK